MRVLLSLQNDYVNIPSAEHYRDLARISDALRAAADLITRRGFADLAVEHKRGLGPVTELDRAIDDLLRKSLPQTGEGWLSEETVDNAQRLQCQRVWIVDPIDGTNEMLAGIDEWGISVGLSDNGTIVAGGICNPARDEVFLGVAAGGLTFNGELLKPPREPVPLERSIVLASRSERRRGEWEQFRHAPFSVREVGSAAYKLALVASAQAQATWTRRRKNEWDIAGGVALVLASGGCVELPDGSSVRFNQPVPMVPGLLAFSSNASAELKDAARAAAHANQ